MEILNALDLQKNKKKSKNKNGSTLTQPLQFLSKNEKDQEWAIWNLDWFEWQGLKQLKRNSRRLLKNYKLANGIIDKSDYIVEEDNEYLDIVEKLIEEDVSALELKFYPIIPNVVNTLCNEFAKRNTRLIYRSVDEFSYNEMLEQKRALLEENLLMNAQTKLMSKLLEAGYDMESEEFQEQMSEENIKSLPEIEAFFRKDYRSIGEEWAQHQYEEDVQRFHMDELEEEGFRDLLVADREFWHFEMYEDDYNIELWNPLYTFYHKSPEVRYISDGNWVGKVDMLTVSDVIDKYGWKMTADQLESLQTIYPAVNAHYPIRGTQNDGSFYDPTRSHEYNTTGPSLAMRQYNSFFDSYKQESNDVVNWILSESEDFLDFGDTNLVRVTTVYWKTQRKLGYLTKLNEFGELITDIVDEDYKITDTAVYNTVLSKNNTKDNLIYGEHIDWLWINEVWGGVKIGPNSTTFYGSKDENGINPIYIGINQNEIGKVKFQFKGSKTMYGCKLPVEGRIFTDRNSTSVSLVDLMKPWQIGYNIVNNQISDILVDELGTVLLFDQNSLPRHSMGEDWGENNLSKAYVAMKNFKMMPLDTSLRNTESATAFQHYQTLNLEETSRLMSRVQLANYFKQQAFENIGVSPQRMGQAIEQETAEGVRAAVNNSFAQTEQYVIHHSDELMPRVHQMRTDLAQYYHSTKPSVRLQYLTTTHEKVNFHINGTELLLREINVHGTTNANNRAVLEKLRMLALNNNTSGATIYDLGNIIKADSIPEITNVMKESEEKVNAQRQQEQQHQQQMEQERLAAIERDKELERQFKVDEADKNRRKDILVAEIRAAGYGAMMDIDQNQQSDFADQMNEIRKTEQYTEQVNLQREKETNKQIANREKLNLEKEKLEVQKKISDDKLKVAQTNKNQYDFKKKNEKK
jgi:hypothetical protein